LQQRSGMSTRVISGFDGLAEEEEDDGVATINPMEEGDEGEDGAMKVAAGMRALGVDRRYNIQKVDLRGIKHAPWVADTCRACFYKPGPDPTGGQPAILVLFPQFVACSVFFTYICFALPVGDACDPDLQKMGEWPTDHMLFYLAGWLQCVIMFLPIPLFGIFLARIGMPVDADSARSARVKACGEDWQTFLNGLKITGFASLSSIVIAMSLARFWTGFPVPFTHLTAGFPGFFIVFAVTAIYLNNDGEDSPRLPQKMVQLVVMQACIFWNISCFAVLSALITASNEPTSPVYGYQLPLAALGFPIAKSISYQVARFALKQDFDNSLPLLGFLNINAAVFPMVALPSAVSITTYLITAFIDVAMTFWSLRVLWLPVVKLSKAAKAIEKEQVEADEAGAKVKKLKDRLREAKENLKNEQTAAQDAKAKALEAQLVEAHAQHLKEQQDVEDAEVEKGKAKSNYDLGGLASEAILVKEGKLEGESDDAFEKRIGVDVDHDGDIAGVGIASNRHLEGKELKDAEDKEFKVVLTVLEEGTEVLIPLLVIFTEVFLYYGWNREAVPTLQVMPNDFSTGENGAPSGFLRSMALKFVSFVVQLGTCWGARYCVNTLCAPPTHLAFLNLATQPPGGMMCPRCYAS